MNSPQLQTPHSKLRSGFLAVNKPRGWTSFDVVAKIRNITGIRQIGHSGTLDPLAEGVLLLALGKVTRLLPYLTAQHKTYDVTIELGKESSTYDLEGEITVHSGQPQLSLWDIEKQLGSFIGEIEQIPPVFSAVKINGQRAYEMARKGKPVDMPKRKVRIDSIKIVSYQYPILRLEVRCGSGTYIRSLAHDLGKKLGIGGIVSRLVRTRIDSLPLEEALSLETITADSFSEQMLDTKRIADFIGLETYTLSADQWEELKHGRNFILKPSESLKESKKEILCIYDRDIVGIARQSTETQSAQPVKVLV